MQHYSNADLTQPSSGPLQQTKAGLFPYLVIVFMPLALLDIRLPLPGIEVRLSDFYLLLMFAAFLLKFKDALSWTFQTLYTFVPFLAYVLLYSALAGNRGGMLEFVQWGFVLLWVPILSYVLRDADEKLIRVLVLSLLAVALYIALAHAAIGKLTGYKLMGDAKYTFGLLALLSALCLLRFKGLMYWGVFIIALVLMALSLERKGVVIFLATMSFVVPLLALKVRSAYIASLLLATKLLVFASGFIIYFFFVRDAIEVTHFLDEDTALWQSNLHRSNLIANGVEIYLDSPWLGVGAKMLRESMSQFYLDTSLALYTHNWYLDFFIEYGLVGVALFLLAIVPAVLNVSVRHGLAWVLLPLAFYCFSVPIFMANGTTTMLIYLTAVASCRAAGWRGDTRERAPARPGGASRG